MRRIRGPAVVGIMVVASLMSGALPASAAPGDGTANGGSVNVTLLGQPAVVVPPIAVANTLPAGPEDNGVASVGVPGILSTGVITTHAHRDDLTGVVDAFAETANVNIPLFALNPITATAIRADCLATQQGNSGSTTLTNINLGALGVVAANPAPNTTINVNVLGIQIAQLIFNEQINNPDGSLTVNALHIVLIGGVLGSIGSGDVIVSQATCGPAAPPIPLASGAGLWIGLGLLGLVAVPVITTTIRRRHTQPAL